MTVAREFSTIVYRRRVEFNGFQLDANKGVQDCILMKKIFYFSDIKNHDQLCELINKSVPKICIVGI